MVRSRKLYSKLPSGIIAEVLQRVFTANEHVKLLHGFMDHDGFPPSYKLETDDSRFSTSAHRRIGNRHREGERWRGEEGGCGGGGGGCGGGGGGGTPGPLSLSTLRTRIRSRVGFGRSPDAWMSRWRTSRQEMQERRRWG